MKATILISRTKIIFLGILAATMLIPFISTAKKYPFLLSTVAPAARGYVKVKNDNNKNYAVEIHISDLAEIDRIQPTMQTYVVWMVTDRDITKNIGRIKSSKKFLSKTLTGYLETISSFQPTKIFITAEVDESVQFPSEKVVLTTDRFWD